MVNKVNQEELIYEGFRDIRQRVMVKLTSI